MSLQNANQELAARFQEAQAFLSAIKATEPPAGTPTPAEINTRKGLAIVLIYGAFEYSITRIMTDTSALITARSVRHDHLHEELYPFALDPQLTAVRMSGAARKWNSRSELFAKQLSTDHVLLNDGCFLEGLRNAWASTVAQAFRLFGVPGTPLYDVKVRHYIDVIVEGRNAVAHGRESATQVGQRYTSAELQKFLDELLKQAQYMSIQFSTYIQDKSFIKTAHRASY